MSLSNNSDAKLDLVLDEAQQPWQAGESLVNLVRRYPEYTEELVDLALIVERTLLSEAVVPNESTTAEMALQIAMNAAL